jgi:hypothetical protein
VYATVLQSHSLLRWVVLLVLAIAFARGLRGWAANMPYRRSDRVASLASVIVVDTQLLLGLVLHFGLSPVTAAGFADVGAAMKDDTLRFFLVEHPVSMVLAVVAVHVGRRRAKRARTESAVHGIVAVSSLIALVLVSIAIPWDRPMLPVLPAAPPG